MKMTRMSGHGDFPAFSHLKEMEEMLTRLAQAGSSGYPPYNIERIVRTDDVLELEIVLAVAGFSIEELEITLERNRLLVRGMKDADEEERAFLHRGIAARAFQKAFALAEGMEIANARLKDGLLRIRLLFSPRAQEIKKISISS